MRRVRFDHCRKLGPTDCRKAGCGVGRVFTVLIHITENETPVRQGIRAGTVVK
jgi:hypothetical protein